MSLLHDSRDDPARVALVTGARRGIGAALATALAVPGRTIFLHIHHGNGAETDEAQAIAARIRARGAQAETIAADLASDVATRRLATTIIEKHGRLDVLVNNAARSSEHSNRWGDGECAVPRGCPYRTRGGIVFG